MWRKLISNCEYPRDVIPKIEPNIHNYEAMTSPNEPNEHQIYTPLCYSNGEMNQYHSSLKS